MELIVEAILGGILIGVSVTLMLFFNGRITGISGILGMLINKNSPEKLWRLTFVSGLFIGGLLLRFLKPDSFNIFSSATLFDYAVAGLLVGFGTQMGNGCTSGHGVCGISRFSIRSLIATLTFIAFGIVSVFIFKSLRGEL